MPYSNAWAILNNPDSTVLDFLDAIEELGIEYGHIRCTVSLGLRKNAEDDLTKIKALLIVLKFKITSVTK